MRLKHCAGKEEEETRGDKWFEEGGDRVQIFGVGRLERGEGQRWSCEGLEGC